MVRHSGGWDARHEIETTVGTIRYRDVGTGPVLVFLHPVLAAGDQWSRIVERLAGRFRCIVPDLPMGGHAVAAHASADLSPPGLAEAVADLLVMLDLDEVTLVGNDTGGAIAQIVAAEHRARIGRLVLTNCDAYENFPPRIFWYLKGLAFVPGGMWLVAQTLRFRALWRLPIAFGWLCNEVDVETARGWGRALRSQRAIRRDAGKVLRSVHRRHTLAAAVRLRSFEKPVLIAWGEDDRAFPVEHAERLLADLPNSQLERIANARTFVMWDQPEALAELIVKFAATT